MKTALAIGVLALCASAPAQSKLDDEQAKLLAAARAESLSYTSSLPDFLCTQVVRRREDPRGDNRWHMIDTLTVRLSYSGHKEDYKLMLVDGRVTSKDFLSVGGSLTTGEFGSRLMALFVPDSKADFEWRGWSHLRGRRVANFHYRIAKETSTSVLQAGNDPVIGHGDSIIVPYRGEVSIDAETHRVLRLTAQAEIPAGFPMTASTTEIDYGPAKVGDKEYLLPLRAEVKMTRKSYISENVVEFKDYRKFHTDATISFDTVDDKPKAPIDKK